MQRLIGTLLVMFIFVYVGQLFETRQVMNTSKVCNVHLRIDWAGNEHDWILAMKNLAQHMEYNVKPGAAYGIHTYNYLKEVHLHSLFLQTTLL